LFSSSRVQKVKERVLCNNFENRGAPIQVWSTPTTPTTLTILAHSSYQEPLISKCLEVKETHVIPSPNLQSKDLCNSPISPNEENKMEFILRLGRARGEKGK
jgi:hypothetical protein